MLPVPLLAFFIFKILLFDFQESVVVGHQTVSERLKDTVPKSVSELDVKRANTCVSAREFVI